MARKKDLSKVKVTLTLTKETNALLDQIAQDRHLNRSQAINKVIKEYVLGKQLEESVADQLIKKLLESEEKS